MIGEDGRPTQRWLATCGVLLALVGGLWFNQNRGLKGLANDTHAALCAFKQDVERRYDAGVEYLLDHPRGLVSSKGEVILGRATLKNSLDAQQATLDALAELHCD